jgi:SAM-dependent methyltransferase
MTMVVTEQDALLRCSDGAVVPLPVSRWMDEPDPVELAMLDVARPPVLDVGCGPGRMVLALSRRGIPTLGVETAPSAVDAGLTRGASILERSIFGAVPGAGRWGTALLFDGTIGIGGCPETLLARLAELLRPGGLVIAELDPPGVGFHRVQARIESRLGTSQWFPWARVDARAIGPLARGAGFVLRSLRTRGGRWFAVLAREP